MPSLAVKYRPKTFEDLVEQSVVRDILVKICDTDPIVVRNFLLIGPAGCVDCFIGGDFHESC